MWPSQGRSPQVTTPKTRLSRTALQSPSSTTASERSRWQAIAGAYARLCGPVAERLSDLSLMRARVDCVHSLFYPGSEASLRSANLTAICQTGARRKGSTLLRADGRLCFLLRSFCPGRFVAPLPFRSLYRSCVLLIFFFFASSPFVLCLRKVP